MSRTACMITQDRYAARSWRPAADFRSAAAHAPVVALAAEEIGTAALSLPLAFVADGGRFMLSPVLGLAPKQNLFVAPTGKWAGRYVPAAFRAYPFLLLRTKAGEAALAFDEDSGLLAGPGEGHPFFDGEGGIAPETLRMREFLAGTTRGQEKLATAAGLLNRHALLQPWPLHVRDGGTERPVGGLLRVDEAGLNRIGADALRELRDGGALAVAYAQLLSMPNIAALGRLAQAHADYRRQHEPAASPAAPQSPLGADLEDKIDWHAILGGR